MIINNFFIYIFFIIFEFSFSYKIFPDDSKCEKFGSIILNHIINKEPYTTNYTDMYKLLLYSGTNLGDLGNYYSCKKIDYANYYVFSAMINDHAQNIGFCYYKECNVTIIENTFQKIIKNLNDNTGFNLLTSKDIFFEDSEKMLKEYRKSHLIPFIILMLIFFVLIFLLPFLQKKYPENDYLSNFNIKQNFIDMFSTKRPENKTMKYLKIFNGIRAFSSLWLILGEVTQIPAYYVKNLADMYFNAKKWYFVFLSSSFFSVDLYLYIAGFFFYFNLNKKSNNLNPNNRQNLLLLIFQRYFRLLPVIIFYTFSGMIITPFIAKGPNYQMMRELVGGCDYNFWHNILTVNDLIKYDKEDNKVCITNLWYLSALIQYCIVCMLIVYFFYYNKIIQKLSFLFLYILSCLLEIYQSMKYEFRYNDIENPSPNDSKFTFYFFVIPYLRVGPFFIGILFANLFVHTEMYKNDYKNGNMNDGENIIYNNDEQDFILYFNNKIQQNCILSCLLFAFGFFLINITFWTSNYANFGSFSNYGNAWRLTFYKDIFIFGCGIIIHLVLLGKLNLLRKLLSWKIYELFTNGSMGVLIFHDFFINMLFYEYPGMFYQNVPDFIFLVIGNFIVSYFLGTIILPFVETPFLKMNNKAFNIEALNYNKYINNENKILDLDEKGKLKNDEI